MSRYPKRLSMSAEQAAALPVHPDARPMLALLTQEKRAMAEALPELVRMLARASLVDIQLCAVEGEEGLALIGPAHGILMTQCACRQGTHSSVDVQVLGRAGEVDVGQVTLLLWLRDAAPLVTSKLRGKAAMGRLAQAMAHLGMRPLSKASMSRLWAHSERTCERASKASGQSRAPGPAPAPMRTQATNAVPAAPDPDPAGAVERWLNGDA